MNDKIGNSKLNQERKIDQKSQLSPINLDELWECYEYLKHGIMTNGNPKLANQSCYSAFAHEMSQITILNVKEPITLLLEI